MYRYFIGNRSYKFDMKVDTHLIQNSLSFYKNFHDNKVND